MKHVHFCQFCKSSQSVHGKFQADGVMLCNAAGRGWTCVRAHQKGAAVPSRRADPLPASTLALPIPRRGRLHRKVSGEECVDWIGVGWLRVRNVRCQISFPNREHRTSDITILGADLCPGFFHPSFGRGIFTSHLFPANFIFFYSAQDWTLFPSHQVQFFNSVGIS